jgi:HEPN domain-containing protein
MTEPLRDEVREWLRKAKHDLGFARKLSQQPNPYLDTAIYHCQQLAEKAVKGFLAFHETPFQRTHDIDVPVSAAAKLEPGFGEWVIAAQMLTPYAAIYRYPGTEGESDATTQADRHMGHRRAAAMMNLIALRESGQWDLYWRTRKTA